MPKVEFEFPRRAVPGYLHPYLGYLYDPRDQRTIQSKDIPPGHRFLLYFHALIPKGQSNLALKAVSEMGEAADKVLGALTQRQQALLSEDCWRRSAVLTSPLLTGSGNPHPVENGFAFLSPYGVPYLAGSGVKGVLRRAAEELAILQEDSRGWTLPLVWVLFGFDATSSLFEGKDNVWAVQYAVLTKKLSKAEDPVLAAFIDALEPEKKPSSQADFLHNLDEKNDFRKEIHWQGLLAFEDAFPDSGAKLGVDILNPHHKGYYHEGKTPHDADQPVPVFFLVLQPGARFQFAARPLTARKALWDVVGDWRPLLDAAFEHACGWLGFGAKTAVGYGRMEVEATEKKAPANGPNAPPREPTAETIEIWDNAIVKYTPNDKTLTVTRIDEKQRKKTAFRKEPDRALMPEALHKKVFEKKEAVKARVTVVVKGNCYEIHSIEV